MTDLYSSTLLGSTVAPVKRKAYFAFHFDDIMRVNNVRNAWKITHPDGSLNRSFYDSSLWESKKLEGDDALKRLIREGVPTLLDRRPAGPAWGIGRRLCVAVNI